jgi:uncharacterized protein YodC (DUF2158 family)
MNHDSVKEEKFDPGDKVVYYPGYGPKETGIVTSVSSHGMVFVRFDGEENAKGCFAEDLTKGGLK